MKLEDAINSPKPLCRQSMEGTKKRLDGIAKPLNGLGVFEDMIIRLAGIQRTDNPDIGKKCTVVMCADNGVVNQGVTQTGQEVTAVVAENIAKGDATVCHMSRIARSTVLPVDVGIYRDVSGEKIINRKIAYGTEDFTKGPAMTREETVRAIEVGIDIAADLKLNGYNLLAAGEMGIGNTTTAAAVTAVLLGLDASVVTGRGAGLSTEGLERKVNAVIEGIRVNKPDRDDAIDVLSKVGGLDIAAMCGLFIGAAAAGICIMIDGVISSVAALCAVRMCPLAREYILPSHESAEPGSGYLLKELEMEPVLRAKMSLGEGTGAVSVFMLMDAAISVYYGMVSFEETNITPYVPEE